MNGPADVEFGGSCHPSAWPDDYDGTFLNKERMKKACVDIVGKPVIREHDAQRRIGTVTAARIDDKDRMVLSAKSSRETPDASAAIREMRNGELSSFSLGMKHQIGLTDAGVRITESVPYEVSVTTNPDLEDTKIAFVEEDSPAYKLSRRWIRANMENHGLKKEFYKNLPGSRSPLAHPTMDPQAQMQQNAAIEATTTPAPLTNAAPIPTPAPLTTAVPTPAPLTNAVPTPTALTNEVHAPPANANANANAIPAPPPLSTTGDGAGGGAASQMQQRVSELEAQNKQLANHSTRVIELQKRVTENPDQFLQLLDGLNQHRELERKKMEKERETNADFVEQAFNARGLEAPEAFVAWMNEGHSDPDNFKSFFDFVTGSREIVTNAAATANQRHREIEVQYQQAKRDLETERESFRVWNERTEKAAGYRAAVIPSRDATATPANESRKRKSTEDAPAAQPALKALKNTRDLTSFDAPFPLLSQQTVFPPSAAPGTVDFYNGMMASAPQLSTGNAMIKIPGVVGKKYNAIGEGVTASGDIIAGHLMRSQGEPTLIQRI